MWLGSGREYEVSSGLQALWTISCLFTSPKCDLSNVEKAMFEVLAVHFHLIFFLLTNPECDFCEVEEAIFHVVAGHCELIFCQYTTSKYNWGEVENAMF